VSIFADWAEAPDDAVLDFDGCRVPRKVQKMLEATQ
jgi:hypothetical protein